MEFEAFKKAVLDTTSGTTGNTLIPALIDPFIIELARTLSPVRNLIPRKPWDSLSYNYRVRTSVPAAQFQGENSPWSLNTGSYSPATQTMKIVGNLGGVSNLLQAGSRAFVDALALEVDGSTRGFVKEEEWGILNASSAANALQFDGIKVQLSTFVYPNAGQINFDLLDGLDDAIKSKGFGVNPETCFWITSPNMATAIARLTAPYYRADGNPMQLVGGFNGGVYRNHKILESSACTQTVGVSGETITVSNKIGTFSNLFVNSQTFDDQLGNLYNSGTLASAPVISVGGATAPASGYTITASPFTGTSTITFTTQPSGAVVANYFYSQQNLFLVDFSTMVMPVLQPLGFEQLPANYAYDQQIFRIKAYECLAVLAERGNAFAGNVFGQVVATP